MAREAFRCRRHGGRPQDPVCPPEPRLTILTCRTVEGSVTERHRPGTDDYLVTGSCSRRFRASTRCAEWARTESRLPLRARSVDIRRVRLQPCREQCGGPWLWPRWRSPRMSGRRGQLLRCRCRARRLARANPIFGAMTVSSTCWGYGRWSVWHCCSRHRLWWRHWQCESGFPGWPSRHSWVCQSPGWRIGRLPPTGDCFCSLFPWRSLDQSPRRSSELSRVQRRQGVVLPRRCKGRAGDSPARHIFSDTL